LAALVRLFGRDKQVDRRLVCVPGIVQTKRSLPDSAECSSLTGSAASATKRN
jgi:hypothetical protein